MRVVLMANGRVGVEVARWLVEQGTNIVGLVVHPDDKARQRDEIVAACAPLEPALLCGSKLRKRATLAALADLEPDIALSIYFGYILRPRCLDLFAHGVINLHPALLPHNRGAHPNVWSIVDGTPAGVTLHYLDPGIDTGDVISQTEVVVEPVDTAKTLYDKLERASFELVVATWPAIVAGTHTRTPQPKEGGSSHRTADLATLDEVELERSYSGRELIDLLRARTFPPHRGAYVVRDGRRVYLRLELSYEQDEDR